jgi:hypothetical protein
VVWWRVERVARHPLIDVQYLLRPDIRLPFATTFLIAFGIYGALTAISLIAPLPGVGNLGAVDGQIHDAPGTWRRLRGGHSGIPVTLVSHSAIYIRADGPLDDPAALSGGRIGVPEWSVTATVYARALLQHQYGQTSNPML